MELEQHQKEFNGLMKLLRSKNQFHLIICEYNDPLYRDNIISKIKLEKENSITIDLSFSVNPYVNDLENQLINSKNYDLINLINIQNREDDAALKRYFQQINFKRENIASIAPTNILLWILEYQVGELITTAPDLWNWNSGLLTFTVKRKSDLLSIIPYTDPEITELNLKENRNRIIDTISFLKNKSKDDFKSADYSLLEQLERVLFNINKYEKIYDYIDKGLLEIKNNIKELIDKNVLSEIKSSNYNRERLIEILYPKVKKIKNINKKEFLELLNTSDNEAQLIQTPVFYQNAAEKKKEKKEEEFILKLISKLFDFAELNDDEKKYLLYFSILPAEKIYNDDLIGYFNISQNNELDFLKSLTKLANNGWLEEKSNHYKMHPLIQCIIREKLKPNAENCRDIIISFANLLNYEPQESPLTRKVLIPYVESIWNSVYKEKNDKQIVTNDLATLANNLAAIYLTLGYYNKALEYQNKSIAIREKVLPENHPSLATSYGNIALTYNYLGNYDIALENLNKSIAIRDKVLPENHPDLATSYSNIALANQDLGNYEKSLEFQNKSISIREKVLESEHPDLATSYNNIAETYSFLGNYEKALEYQKKSIAIREKVLPENHPDLATSYNNIAIKYCDLGNYEKSLEYNKIAIAIIEKILPENHPNLATSYNNISESYSFLGNYEKSLEYQKKSIAIREKVLPENHPDLSVSYNNIAHIYYDLKDFKKAKHYIDKAVEICKIALPENHPYLIYSLERQKKINEALNKQ